MLHSTWTLFTNFRFNWTPFNIGLSLVVMGLVTAVVQGFLLKKLLKVFGEQKLILCGLGSGLPLLRIGHLRPPDLLGNVLQFPVRCRPADAEFHRLPFRPGIRTR